MLPADDLRIDAQVPHARAGLVDSVFLVEGLRALDEVAVLVFDQDFRFRAVYGGAVERTGYDPDVLAGRRAPDVLPAPAWAKLEPHYARTIAGERFSADVAVADGSVFRSTFKPVLQGDEVIGGMVVSVDVTAQRAAEAEAARRAQGRLFEAAFARAPVGMALVRDGQVIAVNDALRTFSGYEDEDLRGRDVRDFLHPDDHAASLAVSARVAAGKPVAPTWRRLRTRDGRDHPVEVRHSLVDDDEDEPTMLIHVLDRRVEAERDRAMVELAAAERLFETLFEHAPLGKLVSRLQPDGATRVVKCNRAFAAMLGIEPDDVVGRSGTWVMHADDLPVRERMLHDMARDGLAEAELRFKHRDGRDVWTYTATARVDEEGGLPLFVLQALDISERKRFETQLQHLVDHDPLTNLFSRRRFEAELVREVDRVRRSDHRSALLLADLDGFKDVNDGFGHSVGDALLVRLAEVLRGTVRGVDVVGRIGGDEFALIAPDTDRAGAEALARKLIDAMREHGIVIRDGRHADVTACIGITTLDGAETRAAEELLVEADLAMYQAKDAGCGRIATYDRGAGRRDEVVRRTDWIGRLRRGLALDQLVLLGQPIVPLRREPDGEHLELLLRLRDEHGTGLVTPEVFLHHAERHGLIVDIDRWVLGQAVTRLHDAHAAGRRLSLAVNFSTRTLQDPTIAEELRRLLAERPVPAGSLTIEVTETAALTNVARASELAAEVRTLGCRLALDDFGAGFASFSMLKHLPFDVLKIDGSYIEHLTTSTTDELIVRAVVDIARGLGAETVAERVVDRETQALVRALGVDWGQGYHLGRPAPLD